MNYNNKSFNWLQDRLARVYSQRGNWNRQYVMEYLNYLDQQRLNNYHITNFNDLSKTDQIAKILELSSDEIYDVQIINLAMQMSEDDLNLAIRNLPENVSLDEIMTKRIEQLILSTTDERIPKFVTRDDLYIVTYLASLQKEQFNPLL